MNETHVLHEITPLMGKDALYIADRHKKEFTYPIHNHDVYELNFVEHAAGVRRIVGDSSEIIGEYDLVLVTSPDLEHVWEQYECKSNDIREITVQFKFGMEEEDSFLGKNPFANIRRMMREARKGLCFSPSAIMKVYSQLDQLSQVQDPFSSVMLFLQILNTLSLSEGSHTLATTSYAKVDITDDSRRVLRVKNYINQNYMEEIKLKTLADLANMSQSAFSRFFKLHSGRTLSDYIIDIRLGNATRMLIDTTESIAEISFSCGYNNLSNFNRIFKRKKGCSPSEFRENYRKIKVIV
ncbi:MAG: AraC family transcriptional regulator [Prevotella sp.]|jgi:AraC-like DNA-binding protein|nr:AraC family transcriptional regulator [Prevotella sp.]